MKAIVLALVLSVGCANVHVNRATLIASTLALACDWAQTRAASSSGWVGFLESNPIMGDRPSTGMVDMYFAGALIANASAWALMPQRFRSAIPVGVVAIQQDAIRSNAGYGMGWCGVGHTEAVIDHP